MKATAQIQRLVRIWLEESYPQLTTLPAENEIVVCPTPQGSTAHLCIPIPSLKKYGITDWYETAHKLGEYLVDKSVGEGRIEDFDVEENYLNLTLDTAYWYEYLNWLEAFIESSPLLPFELSAQIKAGKGIMVSPDSVVHKIKLNLLKARAVLEKAASLGIDVNEAGWAYELGCKHGHRERKMLKVLQWYHSGYAFKYASPDAFLSFLNGIGSHFEDIYAKLSILRAETPEHRWLRLKLTKITYLILRRGLERYGIPEPKELQRLCTQTVRVKYGHEHQYKSSDLQPTMECWAIMYIGTADHTGKDAQWWLEEWQKQPNHWAKFGGVRYALYHKSELAVKSFQAFCALHASKGEGCVLVRMVVDSPGVHKILEVEVVVDTQW